ncbi:hypothetical protein L9F63_015016 [Diploptera punctata]|uniref:U3 small nucleolar ribonucleoprotein protein IMP3 n=1 Tax=Diploptera punctata TaxID=6984 RepID=A0AAD8A753_DIPPU|nr:hypothetical protein L9F63_015016 [Diploptera punctata]
MPPIAGRSRNLLEFAKTNVGETVNVMDRESSKEDEMKFLSDMAELVQMTNPLMNDHDYDPPPLKRSRMIERTEDIQPSLLSAGKDYIVPPSDEIWPPPSPGDKVIEKALTEEMKVNISDAGGTRTIVLQLKHEWMSVHVQNTSRSLHFTRELYKKLSREIRELARKIKDIDEKHPFRVESSAQLLEKLYLLKKTVLKWDLELCNNVNASSFCRRRLPVMMVKSKMCASVSMATKFIQQGHVRVGPEVVKDPAFLLTRNLEDFVTWVDTSAIKRHIMEYNETRDDFEML